MKLKAKRSLIVLFTLIFAVSVFTVTAFATETSSGGITPGDPATEPTSQVVSSEAPASSSSETSTPSSTGSVSSDGGSVSSGTESTVSSSSTGSTVSETPASSHAATSSRAVSSNKPTQSVDTQNSRVEAAASQADAAVSDPGVLSSQDWSELLSNGASSADSAVEAGGTISGLESSSSQPTGQGGGVSWLLILGIAFIVLGLGGIGFFVYAQFFANRRRGPGGPGDYADMTDISSHSSKSSDPIGDTRPLDLDDTNSEPTEFEDISSHSASTPQRGPSANQKSFDNIRPAGTVTRASAAPAEKPKPKKPEVSASDVTAPIPQEALPKREPAVSPTGTDAKPLSQATPVENGKNFDWDKFFNEDDE